MEETGLRARRDPFTGLPVTLGRKPVFRMRALKTVLARDATPMANTQDQDTPGCACGSDMKKLAPIWLGLSAHTVPPCTCATRLMMASPRPFPGKSAEE